MTRAIISVSGDAVISIKPGTISPDEIKIDFDETTLYLTENIARGLLVKLEDYLK